MQPVRNAVKQFTGILGLQPGGQQAEPQESEGGQKSEQKEQASSDGKELERRQYEIVLDAYQIQKQLEELEDITELAKRRMGGSIEQAERASDAMLRGDTKRHVMPQERPVALSRNWRGMWPDSRHEISPARSGLPGTFPPNWPRNIAIWPTASAGTSLLIRRRSKGLRPVRPVRRRRAISPLPHRRWEAGKLPSRDSRDKGGKAKPGETSQAQSGDTGGSQGRGPGDLNGSPSHAGEAGLTPERGTPATRPSQGDAYHAHKSQIETLKDLLDALARDGDLDGELAAKLAAALEATDLKTLLREIEAIEESLRNAGGRNPGVEVRAVARQLEVLSGALDALHGAVVSPRLAELIELESRVAGLRERLEKLTSDSEISQWHLDAQQLMETLERTEAGTAAVEGLRQGMEESGWAAERTNWGWDYVHDNRLGLSHYAAPATYVTNLILLEKAIQREAKELLLRDMISSLNDAVPPPMKTGRTILRGPFAREASREIDGHGMGIETTFHLLSPVSLLEIVGCAVAVLAVLFLLRRFVGPPLALARQPALWVLRGLILAILLAILANPVRVDRSPGDIRRSSVFYLLDTSASMALGESESRFEQAAGMIRDVDQRLAAEERPEISVYRFGQRLEAVEAAPSSQLDDVAPTDADTQLLSALRQLTGRFGGAQSPQVVLLSDGRAREPVGVEEMAARYRDLEVPIHVVPLGELNRGGDIAVVNMVTPDRVRKYSQVGVTVWVRSYGYDGLRTELLLKGRKQPGQDVQPLVRLPVTLSSGVQTFNLTFQSDLHTKQVEASIPVRPDEVSPRNNSVSADILVDRTKIRVLYIEGSNSGFRRRVGPDGQVTLDGPYSALQAALSADPDIECAPLLAPPGSGLPRSTLGTTRAFPETRARLFAFDAIILSDVGRDHFSDDQLALIDQWIRQRGGGSS